MFYKKIREICLPEIKTYSPTGISDSGVHLCMHACCHCLWECTWECRCGARRCFSCIALHWEHQWRARGSSLGWTDPVSSGLWVSPCLPVLQLQMLPLHLMCLWFLGSEFRFSCSTSRHFPDQAVSLAQVNISEYKI